MLIYLFIYLYIYVSSICLSMYSFMHLFICDLEKKPNRKLACPPRLRDMEMVRETSERSYHYPDFPYWYEDLLQAEFLGRARFERRRPFKIRT